MEPSLESNHDYEIYWKNLSRSSQYHPANRLRYYLIENAIAQMLPSTPLSVLDAGCGDGSLLSVIGKNRFWKSMVGIDISQEIVKQNRSAYKDRNFFAADLGMPDGLPPELRGRFDLVLSSEVIEHVPNDAQFAKNLFELCKPGGYLILTTQAGPRFTMDLEVLGHLRHYKKEELEMRIRDAGFDIEQSLQTGFPWLSLQKRAVETFSGFVKKTLATGGEPTPVMKTFLNTLSTLYRFNVKGLGPQLLIVAKKRLTSPVTSL